MRHATFSQLSDRLHGRLGILKEVAAGGLMHRPKRSAPELSADPFLRNPKPFGELRHRQAARDRGPASSLSRCLHAMTKPDTSNCAGQDLGASPWRAMSLSRQHSRDLVVIETVGGEFADALLHLGMAGKRCQRVYRHHDGQFGRSAAAPHDAHLRPVTRAPSYDDLVNQATQQRLAVLATGRWVCPELGELLTEGHNLRPQARIDADSLARRGDRPSRQCFFRAPQFDKSSLPSPLELAGHESVVGVNTVELTLGKHGLITQPLNLLLLGVSQRFIRLPLCFARPR
jgi:hypothetical protein